MPIIHYLIAGAAAISAGLINALAGGGTLITFPTLISIGLSPVVANVTNTIALCPGFLGGTLAQTKDLKGQERRLWLAIPAALLGGLTGGYLLLRTSEKLFANLVPFLIILAASLLAVQNPVRNWLARRQSHAEGRHLPEAWICLPIFLGAIYGGYFGAGLSIIMLAVLGLILNDNLTRLNAVKQVIGFGANIAAALLFVFSGKINWAVGVVMMAGALLGGSFGGRLASRVKPNVLRWIVVTIGFVVGTIYLIKTYFLK
ncbi:MAG TPA: sulfite exporter TauE/SafE family protein [Anaerolineales bacterium]|nr:sulfite exporter TauE/SafE family protein [Anaerolineales bacterium]